MDTGLNEQTETSARKITVIVTKNVIEDRAIPGFCKMVLSERSNGIHPPFDYKYKRRVKVSR